MPCGIHVLDFLEIALKKLSFLQYESGEDSGERVSAPTRQVDTSAEVWPRAGWYLKGMGRQASINTTALPLLTCISIAKNTVVADIIRLNRAMNFCKAKG